MLSVSEARNFGKPEWINREKIKTNTISGVLESVKLQLEVEGVRWGVSKNMLD